MLAVLNTKPVSALLLSQKAGGNSSVRKEALRLISQYDIGWLQQREMLVYGFCGVLAGCTAGTCPNSL